MRHHTHLAKMQKHKSMFNTWLRRISPLNGEWHMGTNDQEFTESIFDLHSFPTRTDRIATVSFVYEATAAARRAAIAHRDAR